MCLAQGHSAVPPVRLEPVSPRSQVKHSTTEPLHSLKVNAILYFTIDNYYEFKCCVENSVGPDQLDSSEAS